MSHENGQPNRLTSGSCKEAIDQKANGKLLPNRLAQGCVSQWPHEGIMSKNQTNRKRLRKRGAKEKKVESGGTEGRPWIQAITIF